VPDLRLATPTSEAAAAATADAEPVSQSAVAALPEYLDAIERKAILEALRKTGFNRTAAARLLGITFRQLRYRMARLGIREDENPG
jgi:two-component system, NtrC family, response regulator PilR